MINIIKRLNSGITQWNITQDIKEEVDKVFEHLKIELLQNVGINLTFQVEGNACRLLLAENNHTKVMSLVHVEDRETRVIYLSFY